MKKRMLTVMPALLVMVVFLFSGLTVQAQTLATSGAAEYILDFNGKTPIVYMDVEPAMQTIKTDYLSTFPQQEPDETNAANASIIYKMKFYQKAHNNIAASGDVSLGILSAFGEIQSLANAKWPNLVTQTWYDDMVTLLSL